MYLVGEDRDLFISTRSNIAFRTHELIESSESKVVRGSGSLLS